MFRAQFAHCVHPAALAVDSETLFLLFWRFSAIFQRE
jgi:hypothetical protein